MLNKMSPNCQYPLNPLLSDAVFPPHHFHNSFPILYPDPVAGSSIPVVWRRGYTVMSTGPMLLSRDNRFEMRVAGSAYLTPLTLSLTFADLVLQTTVTIFTSAPSDTMTQVGGGMV